MNTAISDIAAPKPRTAAFLDVVEYLNYHEFPRYRGKDKLGDTVFVEEDRIRAQYASFQLDSMFQPIFDLNTRRIIGHEGLLSSFSRGNQALLGNVLAPERVFTLEANQDIVFLDRLARTLHTLNFLAQESRGLLHLNVHPQHLLAVSADHGRVFAGIIRKCGLEPPQIVLEITEYAINDKKSMHDAVAAWQGNGYRIALDGFGRQHTQTTRALKLLPDYLKLDNQFLMTSLRKKRGLQQLEKIVNESESKGVKVIGVGIENSMQLSLLREVGIHRVQGYLFGRPQPYCLPGATQADFL